MYYILYIYYLMHSKSSKNTRISVVNNNLYLFQNKLHIHKLNYSIKNKILQLISNN